MKHLKEYEDLDKWSEDTFGISNELHVIVEANDLGLGRLRKTVDDRKRAQERIEFILEKLTDLLTQKGLRSYVTKASIPASSISAVGGDFEDVSKIIEECGMDRAKLYNSSWGKIYVPNVSGSISFLCYEDGTIKGLETR